MIELFSSHLLFLFCHLWNGWLKELSLKWNKYTHNLVSYMIISVKTNLNSAVIWIVRPSPLDIIIGLAILLVFSM